MSTDIKELVKRLRDSAITLNRPGGILNPSDWVRAADAIEALAGEVDSLKLSNDLFQGAQKLEAGMNTQLTIQLQTVRAERDRLKAALEEIKTMPTRIYQNHSTAPINKILFEAQQFVAGACAAIARKALGDAS